jgi:hypothetical protein
MTDLFQWNQALNEGKLVKKQLLEKAYSRYRLKNGNYSNYGYGWILDSLYARKCIYHAGQVSGFISFEWYFPDEDVFIALATNVKSGEDKTAFSDTRFQLFFQVPFLVFDYKVGGEIVLNNSVLNRYSGKYKMGERTISVYREGNKLFALFGSPFALHAVSETRFFAPGAPSSVWVEFIKDRAGKVTHMIVNQNGLYTWSRISD